MLLLELSSALPLFPFDTFPLSLGEHLLVLDSQFAAMDIHSIHRLDNNASILGGLEVGESESSKNAIIEMVVESIGLGKVHVQHDGSKRLFADSKRDVLNDDGGRD